MKCRQTILHGHSERPRDMVGMSDPLATFQVFSQSLAIAQGGGGLISYTPLKNVQVPYEKDGR